MIPISRIRIRWAVLLALLSVGALALAACSAGSGGGSGGTKTPVPTSTSTPRARLTTTPGDGAKNVGINTGDIRAAVENGTLTSVTLTDQNTGRAVPGAMAGSKVSWRPDKGLERGTPYVLTAKAKDPGGKTLAKIAHFTTVSEANSVIAFFTPEASTKVGVGMEVSFNLDKPVKNEKAVESAVTITSSGGEQAVGHWFNPQRLDFRPKAYWTPGSVVEVRLNLAGVEVSPGVFGVQDKTFTFTVGRSQISTVDAAKQSMTVVRDGSPLKTIPVSSGSPAHGTYNGTMVISEKYQQTKMDSTTVGLGSEYNIPDVPHAQRLTRSGTFIHGNYWAAPSTFGAQATSHGCVGMRDAQGGTDTSTPAGWFYTNSLIGDVVIVKNSAGGGNVAPDNGINGWNLSWDKWTAGSALK
ncbi:Ig-like domain-containing protein [Streptomyces sp. NBC_01020]|uniref:L,D-transpeptidase n=1 Tax=unclassified Streptomyces TaxID=2593676 RepID=UPI0022507395|nr:MULTISPECIES: Ig-like domain-containing protein [unclassified Streptomyces]MCX4724210.1 Ig-like domain-containing protein [Streptomyces sp. NBC_01306]WSV06255.1 Ig-like domain-containing protein [Streptomyces sp. NBC_01020]WSX67611.1 Ig-like domain-containing protein [Streptomyces sp. NBC_00932]